MKKTYEICGLTIEAEDGGASLIETLKIPCPYCNQTDCYFDCDQSTWDNELETEDDTNNRKAYNDVMDGIEALLVALAAEGVDVSQPAFQIAVQAAQDAAANEHS
jgi:hypothetical protein